MTMLRLAVTVVCEVFEQAADTKFADVLFGCFGRNLQLFGDRKISFAVELWRKVVEKGLSDNSLTIGGIALCGGQRTENFGSVLKKHTSHSKSGLKIGIVADDEV